MPEKVPGTLRTHNSIAQGDLRWRASKLARATPRQRLGGDEAGADGCVLRGTPADCEAEPRFRPADETTRSDEVEPS